MLNRSDKKSNHSISESLETQHENEADRRWNTKSKHDREIRARQTRMDQNLNDVAGRRDDGQNGFGWSV